MMFGMYAKYFQEQNPKEGEFLTLVNPQSCDLWQFPGDENSGIFLKFEIGPLLHTRVCLHPFYPQIPLIRTEIAEKTDDYVQQISITPNINRKRSKPSLKIGTASAICWNYQGLFRDYG